MEATKTNPSTIEKLLDSLGDKLHLTEAQIKILVRTVSEGSLAILGKSPQLEFTSISADISLQNLQISGTVHIHPEAVRIISSHISDADKALMSKEIQEKIFETSQNSEIRFEVSGVSTSFGPDVALLKGTLFFRGIDRRIALPLKLIGASRLVGSISLSQSDFGIAPLTAFGGLLRAKDEVEIFFEILLPTVVPETE